MDRFDSLQLFARIVELGSFSRAAAALNLPRATATHAIKALEERLGARLLERTTRHVHPTSDGQAFYARCVRLLAELENAEAALRPASAQPRGILRVDMHGTHAARIVLPRMAEFHARYPDIEVVVSSGDRLVDLVREGVDCVLRAGTPRDSSLVARRLALMPQVVCASPGYLAAHGQPRHPQDLAQHHMVRFFASNGAQDYPIMLQVDGRMQTFSLPAWMAVNDAENYVVCGLHGAGLIQLPRFHVADALRAGTLVEVLAAWPSPALPLSVLYPRHRQRSPRVRVLIDWLSRLYAAEFGPLPSGRA